METTVCPWCHTEIVWDEEFGPEETCPHCSNELSSYRTVNVTRESLEEDLEAEDELEDAAGDDNLWDDNDKDGVVPIFNTLDQFRDEYDLHRYEENVASVLASQEEAPECTQCHELTLFAGKQVITGFEPSVPAVLGTSFLQTPFSLNLYVCPACFHAQHSLAQEDRVQWVRNLGKGHK